MGADSFRIFLYLPLQKKIISASAKENGFNQKEQIPGNKQAVMSTSGLLKTVCFSIMESR